MRRPVPGTAVSLIPPPDFADAGAFTGFVRPALEASIGVTELPMPADQVRSRLDPGEALRSADGREVTWHREAAASVGGEVVRYTAVVGDEHRAVVVVATTPLEHDPALAEAFRAVASSIVWDPADVRARTAGLPFTLDEAPPMRIAARMGAVLLLTPGGGVRGGAEPMMTVGHAPVEPDRDLAEVADGHLRSVPQLARIRVVDQGQQARSDVVVHHLEAEAELSDGTAVTAAQWVVAGIREQVFALAVWPAGTDDDVRAGCAAVAASIRLTG